MKEKFKLTLNTLLVITILAVAVAANLVTTFVNSTQRGIASLQSYNESLLPLNILELVRTLVLVLMGLMVFLLVRKIISKQKWNKKYYGKIRQIGWLGVSVILLNAVSFVVREDYVSQGKAISNIAADTAIYSSAISEVLFASPLSWFSIVCIFLVADVLEYLNREEPGGFSD